MVLGFEIQVLLMWINDTALSCSFALLNREGKPKYLTLSMVLKLVLVVA